MFSFACLRLAKLSLPHDKAIASRSVFVIVSGSDGFVETLLGRVWVKREIAKMQNAKPAMGKMRKYVGENEVRKLGKLRKCENVIISV